MKVQNDLSRLSQIAGPAEVAAVQSAIPGTSNAARTDEAHLSAAAQLVSRALALSEVRTDKIAGIQAALANGSYQVSASDVAAKMIDHARLNHQ